MSKLADLIEANMYDLNNVDHERVTELIAEVRKLEDSAYRWRKFTKRLESNVLAHNILLSRIRNDSPEIYQLYLELQEARDD